MAQHEASDLGELGAGLAPVEQGCAHFGLQGLDAARQRRLGEVDGGRGATEVAVLGHSDQVTKPTQFHACTLLITMMTSNALDT